MIGRTLRHVVLGLIVFIWVVPFVALVTTSLRSELASQTSGFWTSYSPTELGHRFSTNDKGETAEVTDAAAGLLPDGEMSADIWQPWTTSVAEATGAKGRGLFMPLRLALTGREKGPEIAPLLAFIGRDRIIARLRGESV